MATSEAELGPVIQEHLETAGLPTNLWQIGKTAVLKVREGKLQETLEMEHGNWLPSGDKNPTAQKVVDELNLKSLV